jgi:hypothetical protein
MGYILIIPIDWNDLSKCTSAGLNLLYDIAMNCEEYEKVEIIVQEKLRREVSQILNGTKDEDDRL